MKRIFYVIGVLLTFGAIYYADAIPPSPSAPPSGSTLITTLGTVTTGTWNGNKIGIEYGGTNATNATDARTNLGLGTLATQNADAINATGGNVTGLTNLGAANLTVTGTANVTGVTWTGFAGDTTGNAATATTATTANALATNATGTNLSLGGVANVTGLATLSGGSTYGTPVTHSASENATAATHYGQTHRITGAYTVTIPALSVGQKAQYCSTTAAVFSLDSTSPNYWKLAGTNTDAGDKLTSDGSSGCMYFEVTDTNTLMLIWSTLNLTDGGA